MPDEWDISDDEIDSWLEEWEAVDGAAAEYLAERIPGALDVLTDNEARWLEVRGVEPPPDLPSAREISGLLPCHLFRQHSRGSPRRGVTLVTAIPPSQPE
jgi:hypothetical protein